MSWSSPPVPYSSPCERGATASADEIAFRRLQPYQISRHLQAIKGLAIECHAELVLQCFCGLLCSEDTAPEASCVTPPWIVSSVWRAKGSESLPQALGSRNALGLGPCWLQDSATAPTLKRFRASVARNELCRRGCHFRRQRPGRSVPASG